MEKIMPKLISFLGLWVMVLLAWLLSENRKRIHVRLIITGILFQLVFALLILKTGPGRIVFDALQRFVNGIIACGQEGSAFVFGDGFANFGSVAIQIGGVGSMVPSRREDIAQLSMRSMIGGTLACFMTACIVGMLI